MPGVEIFGGGNAVPPEKRKPPIEHDVRARPLSSEEIKARSRGLQDHLPFGHKVKPPGIAGSGESPEPPVHTPGRMAELPTPMEEAEPPRPRNTAEFRVRPAFSGPVRATPVPTHVDTTPEVRRPFMEPPPEPRPPRPVVQEQPTRLVTPPAPRPKKKDDPGMAGLDDQALEKRFEKLEL